MEVEEESADVGLAVQAGGPQVGVPVGRIGCVEGEDAPVAGSGRVRDGPAVEVGHVRHVDGGEEEYAAFDGECSQDLASHHGGGERGRCQRGDAAAAGHRLGVGGAQGAVDGGGEFVVVQA